MRRRSLGRLPMDTHTAFVAGRARPAPYDSSLFDTREDLWDSEAWQTVLESASSNNKHARPPKRTVSPVLVQTETIEKARVVSPIQTGVRTRQQESESHGAFANLIIDVDQVDPKKRVYSYWSASGFRRAIAQICYSWRSVYQARITHSSQLRACFAYESESRDAAVRSWLDASVFLYDVFSNIERQVLQASDRARLLESMHMKLSFGKRDQRGVFIHHVMEDSGLVSRLLTNIKSFLSEYQDLDESEWYQERVATFESRDSSHLITTRMTKDTLTHAKETIVERVACASSTGHVVSVCVESREPMGRSDMPVMTLTRNVRIEQKKRFRWSDQSYAHTVHASQTTRPSWTLNLSLVWYADTMLAVDALMASRSPPMVVLEIETGPLSQSVRSYMAAELTLYSLSAVYAMSAVAMIPRDREEWTWGLD